MSACTSITHEFSGHTPGDGVNFSQSCACGRWMVYKAANGHARIHDMDGHAARLVNGHTPAPWEVVMAGDTGHYGVMAADGTKIALLSSRSELREAEANAQLIGQSPDMRRCIAAMLERCKTLGVSFAWPEFDEARRLIGKDR